MPTQPPLAGSKLPYPADLARQEIEKLVREKLIGRKIDGVGFVEELLTLASQVGELRCLPAADHGLRFELPGSDPFEVDLDANRGKLRMLCARLAVLCQENGHEFMVYGGQGTIRRTVTVDLTDRENDSAPLSMTWKAHWSNTSGQHEFTIQAL